MAMAGALLGAASCSQDTDPVLQTPTTFVLNVPAMQEQYIEPVSYTHLTLPTIGG